MTGTYAYLDARNERTIKTPPHLDLTKTILIKTNEQPLKSSSLSHDLAMISRILGRDVVEED